MRASRRVAGLAVAMLSLGVIGCTDSSKPGSTATASVSTTTRSGVAPVAPWIILDDPPWTVRKADDHPQPVPPLPQTWFLEYHSFITPNTEASVVLAALTPDRISVDKILGVAPPEWISHADVLGHDAFVLDQKSTTGSPAGTTVFWQDDSQVWMMLTGTSELTRDDVLALAGHLVIVTDARWHEAAAARAFSS